MPYNRAMPSLVPWLAGQIAEHLAQEGAEPGTHIVEQRLANRFKVSRSPVRRALALLAETNAVERHPNRGYFVAQKASAAARTEIAAAGDDDDPVYYRIAEERVRGEIPDRVTEMALARRYRTTRAHIRGLLARMAKEGWIQRLPGHGWAFEPVLASAEGYEKSFHYRAVIETAALRTPGYQLAPEAIERLRQRQRALLDGGLAHMSDAEVFEIGATFHEVLVGGSGNPFFVDGIRRVNALRRLLEYRAKRSREKVVRQCTEHLKLLDLIEGGKLEQAARFLEKHLAVALRTKVVLVSKASP
jgi:DNA-binding GntR family transcriptional regulator